MLKPRALKPGDRIAVVSPASPFDRDEFDAGLGELRALGFEPVHDARVFARRGYVSGEARLRADAFMDAWRDPAIAGVVAVRGGYGSVQLLPLLDPAELRQTPKVFVGYSDLTSMLVFLGNCGIVSFHGPMLAGKLGRGDEGYDRASFLAAVTGTAPLSQVLASLATPYAFDPPAGCLLFIDEVGERPYRLDRMLTQLRLAGLLDRAAGIVFGQMPRCDEPRGDPRARSVVQDLLAGFRGPVLYGFPSGHTTTPAMTLPLGIEAAIVADDDPRLVIEEAAVT
jgi:muramoyltetrapeptide carboxypeptidase